MKVIFETNARQHLLQHLGFNAETIAAAADQFTEKTSQNGVDLAATDGAKPPAASSKAADDMVKALWLVTLRQPLNAVSRLETWPMRWFSLRVVDPTLRPRRERYFIGNLPRDQTCRL
jgi:hypothetical protein